MGQEDKKEIAEVRSSTPAEMIKLAVTQGADLDKLEKLLGLQERWEKNEALKAYNVAMAAFKADPPKIGKDKTVNYSQVKYSHASLYNVTEKINTALSNHGLSASWQTKQNGEICITCKITHKQGHSEETTLQAPADKSGSKNNIQAIGSTITYLQRYTLLAITGLATHEQDDDGQATQEVVEKITDDQHHQICDLIEDKGVDVAKFCKAYGIEKIEDLPKKIVHKAILILTNKKSVKK